MATLVIITHEYDAFINRGRSGNGPQGSPYLLFRILRHFDRMGHRVRVAIGPNAIEGDAALLHVDATFVDEDYLALAANYRATVNFGVHDISKRRISNLRLERGDDWAGQVLIKSNLNSKGATEKIHNDKARAAGRPLPHPDLPEGEYRVLESIVEIDPSLWDDQAVTIERFLPNPQPDGNFATYSWLFLGEEEMCTRFVTSSAISKASNSYRFEPVEVPEAIRAERERLGFDYGKFDFLLVDGEPKLVDANRTPGLFTADYLRRLQPGFPILARGLDQLLRQRGVS